MKKSLRTVSLITSAALSVSLQAMAADYFKADFENGSLPEGMTTQRIGASLDASVYKSAGIVENAWSSQKTAEGYAAMCGSFTGGVNATRGVMTTPEFTVASENAFLRWDARSMLADFPDSYVVKAVSGNEEVVLKEIGQESYNWVSHVASLKRFAGKKVKIVFECQSSEKYLLAIDNIWAGESTAESFFTKNETKVYQKQTQPGQIVLNMLNTGMPCESVSVVVYQATNGVATDQVLGRTVIDEKWTTGEWREVTVSIEPKTETMIEYVAKTAGGKELASGPIRFSAFERRHIVEEPTGMSCINCPSGFIGMEKYEKIYREQIISIKPHANDIFLDQQYWKPLGVYAMPCYLMDHSKTYRSQSITNVTNFEKGFNTPTIADLKVTGYEIDMESENKFVTFFLDAEFSQNLDNSSDRYRTGVTFTYDVYRPTDFGVIFQRNDGTGGNASKYGAYIFMPSTIPAPLVKLNKIATYNETTFEGMTEVLPTEITAGEVIETGVLAEIPSMITDLNKAYAVIYLLDAETGDVLNAVELPLSSITGTGVKSVREDSGRLNLVVRDGSLRVVGATGEKCELNVYGTDGMLLRTAVSENGEFALDGLQGVVICRVRTAGKSGVARIVLTGTR